MSSMVAERKQKETTLTVHQENMSTSPHPHRVKTSHTNHSYVNQETIAINEPHVNAFAFFPPPPERFS